MKRIVRKAINLMIRIYGVLLLIFTKRKKDPLSKNIAIVKLDLLGDGILWLQYGIAIRKFYEEQGYRVHLICNTSMREFYKTYGGFEQITAFHHTEFRTFSGIRKIVRSLRKQAYQKALNAVYSRSRFLDDFVMRAISAQEKIAYYGNQANQKNIKRTAKIYTACIDNPEKESELAINAYFAQRLGININAEHPDLSQFVQDASYKPYAVLGLGASDFKRAWSVENFAEVSNWILSNTDLDIRLVGVKSENVLSEKLMSIVSNERMIDMCGKTDFKELLTVLGNAALSVCNDTGTAHITAAVKTPGVVILGGGQHSRFFPHVSTDGKPSTVRVAAEHQSCAGCGWKCRFPLDGEKWQCITAVKPEQVIEEIKRILESGSSES